MSQSIIAAQDDFREMLKQSSELLNEIRWGVDGYLDRIDEMRGNFPGGGGSEGGRSKGSYSDPTSSAGGKRDPGAAELAEFRKRLTRLYQSVLDLHATWDRNRAPRVRVSSLADPGCQPCTSIPTELPDGSEGYPLHYCPTHTTADVKERTVTKKGKVMETAEKVRLCSSCYTFWRRNERLPTVYEVVDHVVGRRRVRKAG